MTTRSLAELNVLVLYNETQTFTSTVFEHLDAFARFSRARVFFAHQDRFRNASTDLHLFDVVIIHYSIRLPFDQISEATAEALSSYGGLKVLFIQDEYDFTQRAWHWIRRLGIRLVFTSVPTPSIERVYPPAELPGVRLVNNLTGYAPASLPAFERHSAPSTRPLKIGYRGRVLPLRYGRLAREKSEIGKLVKAYCESHGVEHDIAWLEEDRLYGDKWFEFIASCRAVLGTESGSNVFDWDGTLTQRVAAYVDANPKASDEAIYAAVIAPLEMPGLMNQISARVFEAIACRTVLVLFEGEYSGIVEPGRHFIPLRKDGSNLDDVIRQLGDAEYVDEITTRAYEDVLASGAYGYPAFIAMVDREIEACRQAAAPATATATATATTRDLPPMVVRTRPHRHEVIPGPVVVRVAKTLTPLVPSPVKEFVKRFFRGMITPSH